MKTILPFLIFASGVALAQPALVKGTLPASFAGKPLQLTLMNYENRNDKKVQDITSAGDASFTITIPLTEPAIYTLSVKDSALLQILAKPGDNIELQIKREGIVAKGSKDTQYLIDYETNRRRVFTKYLRRTYDSSAVAVKSGNKEKIEYWNVEHEKASAAYKAELAQWVEQPFFLNSLAVVHHSMRWHSDNDIALINKIVASLQKNYPNAELTRQLVSKANATKRIAIGATAPDFQSTDIDGKKIDIKNYRGHYTLVDFWASWCGPCRQESPTLVRLYGKYNAKGFTILSVSIDKDAAKWKEAIRKDGYTWENVSELDGYSGSTAALYTVTAIPNSFLLDKDGKIIAKNLRGKELEKKLVELLGK